MYKKGDVVYLEGANRWYTGIVLVGSEAIKIAPTNFLCGWGVTGEHLEMVELSRVNSQSQNHCYVLFGDRHGLISPEYLTKSIV